MWMPRFVKERRQRLAVMHQETEARTARADEAVEDAKVQARRSSEISRRSAELSQANNIAAILAGSLRINGHTPNHHYPDAGH